MISSNELEAESVSEVLSEVKHQQFFSGDVKKNTGELQMQNSSFISGQIFYTLLSSFLSENNSNYFIKISGMNKGDKKEIILNLVYFIFVHYYWSNVSVDSKIYSF